MSKASSYKIDRDEHLDLPVLDKNKPSHSTDRKQVKRIKLINQLPDMKRKKIFIGVLFLFLTVSSQAQNMLGYSVKDVRKNLNDEGVIVNSGYTDKDSIYYISGQESKVLRVYYFDPSNKCIMYLAFIDSPKEQLVKYLIDDNYYKTGEYYYKEDHKVRIFYDEDIKSNYLQFTEK
jgi:hypothetical protein